MAVFIPMPSARVSTARNVNAGDLRSWRMAKRRSIISQRSEVRGQRSETSFGMESYDGIDGAGSPRGQPAGNERDEHERRREQEKCNRIARADSVEQRRHQSRQSERGSDAEDHP